MMQGHVGGRSARRRRPAPSLARRNDTAPLVSHPVCVCVCVCAGVHMAPLKGQHGGRTSSHVLRGGRRGCKESRGGDA
jgi:hypothetical protein